MLGSRPTSRSPSWPTDGTTTAGTTVTVTTTGATTTGTTTTATTTGTTATTTTTTTTTATTTAATTGTTITGITTATNRALEGVAHRQGAPHPRKSVGVAAGVAAASRPAWQLTAG